PLRDGIGRLAGRFAGAARAVAPKEPDDDRDDERANREREEDAGGQWTRHGWAPSAKTPRESAAGTGDQRVAGSAPSLVPSLVSADGAATAPEKAKPRRSGALLYRRQPELPIDVMDHMSMSPMPPMPPIPPPPIGLSSFGCSATIASVVRIRP